MAPDTSTLASDGGSQIDKTWPSNMDRETASRYLNEEHSIPTTPRQIARWLTRGIGPVPVYLGNKPFYARPELDRWAREEAWSDEPTMRRQKRAKRLAARS